MKKLIWLGLILILFVGGYFGYKYMNNNQTDQDKDEQVESPTKAYSMEEIAKHSSKEDCWLAIDNNVYDVTSYVKSGFHPGKEAILMGCGKDATELFNTRPMGSGTSHSDKARAMIGKFKIGIVAGS